MSEQDFQPGDQVWLKENDWCGSYSKVTIFKIFKAGNCIVTESDGRRREANINRIEIKPPPNPLDGK